MARAPDERVSKAYEMYKQGMKLVEIANQLNVPDSTVRRWKCEQKWDGERSEKKSERSEKKKSETNPTVKEVKQIMDNHELTDKQRLFILYMSKLHNGTKAYQKAYECDEYTARVNASKLLAKTNIKAEYDKLVIGKFNRAYLSEEDIFQKYMDIAFADITEYVTFGKKEITLSDKEGREATIESSYVDVNESWMVDGSLIAEISQGKEGIKLKLADRMKALEWLSNHMNMATEEQKQRLEFIKAQTTKIYGTDNQAELKRLDEVLGEIKGVV
jgi:phage terminase small subunit